MITFRPSWRGDIWWTQGAGDVHSYSYFWDPENLDLDDLELPWLMARWIG